MIIDLVKSAIQTGDEVISAQVLNFGLDGSVVDQVCEMARKSGRGRFRLCIHRDSMEKQQEMLIVHPRCAYVPPHKHMGKPESLLVLRGKADYFLFDNDGIVTEKIELGDQYSKKCFFFRVAEPKYHSMLIRSEELVFMETTQGPFVREDNIVAPWAPDPNDVSAVDRFLESLANADSSC